MVLYGKDYVAGTHLTQKDYETLDKNFVLNEDEAKARINKEFGFEFSRIKIVRTVETFTHGEKHRIEFAERYDRMPIYEASDLNYIRFDCAGNQWEMIDGDIYGYED